MVCLTSYHIATWGWGGGASIRTDRLLSDSLFVTAFCELVLVLTGSCQTVRSTLHRLHEPHSICTNKSRHTQTRYCNYKMNCKHTLPNREAQSSVTYLTCHQIATWWEALISIRTDRLLSDSLFFFFF